MESHSIEYVTIFQNQLKTCAAKLRLKTLYMTGNFRLHAIHESIFPAPEFPHGPFRIFTKISGDHSQLYVYRGQQFFPGVVDTVEQPRRRMPSEKIELASMV